MTRLYQGAAPTSGQEAPLDFASANGLRLERRAISLRWFVANTLMGCAAATLLIGALYSAVDRRLRLARAPVAIVRPTSARWFVVESGRRARLRTGKATPPEANHSIEIEQLGEAGGGMKRFTHLFARLGEVSDEAPGVQSAQSNANSKPSEAATPFGGLASVSPALPPEILTGRSGPSLPTNVSAYAPAPAFRVKPVPVLGDPINVTAVTRTDRKALPSPRVIVARAGDSLRSILGALHMSDDNVEEIAALLQDQNWFGLSSLTGGEEITVFEDVEDAPSASYRPLKVSLKRNDASERMVALADSGHYAPVAAFDADWAMHATAENAPDDASSHSFFDASLHDSLYALARARHLDASLVDALARLCASDVDLEKPVSRSDTLDLLYDADAAGNPEPVFIALTVDGHAHHYYRYVTPDDGSTDFYDSDGHSITKFLLRKPVAAGRLGDGFGWRIHPVLHDRRFHQGVDYAAPFGSPIVAAGAGTVEKIDQQWGYGKYIRIRHDLGYETTYAHISSVPHGINVGDRVHQGQTIAYIGSTGLSTGPHIYYEVRINGRNVDPLRVKLFGGRVLTGDALRAFAKMRTHVDEMVHASALAPSGSYH